MYQLLKHDDNPLMSFLCCRGKPPTGKAFCVSTREQSNWDMTARRTNVCNVASSTSISSLALLYSMSHGQRLGNQLCISAFEAGQFIHEFGTIASQFV